jgi:PUB domain
MESEHMKSVTSQLQEMGFEAAIIEKAYNRSDIKTVEGLVNFIEAHPNLANEPDTPAGTNAPAEESPGESISAHVNQALVEQIVQAGYTKDCAEKGLFMTQNATVEAAIQWLEQHKGDPDFLEPLFIVRQQPTGPQLTPEEAKKKAKELQNKIREERLKRDKEAELQAEITRLKSGKGLTAAARELEEAQTKLAMMQLQREREETERAKRKVMEEIEKDRRERGLKSQADIKKPINQVYPDIIKKMQKIYPDPETVKVCLKTLSIYLSKQPMTLENYLSNPTEEKFRRINGENVNFKARVGDIMGGKVLLREVGFEENGTFLEIAPSADISRVKELVSHVEDTLSKMN